jgi:hypothetical protein
MPWIANRLTNLFPRLSSSSRHGELSSIAREYGIPIETLRRWRQHLQADPDWRPTDTRWGQHRRIFTHLTELAISAQIRSDFILKHRLFTTEDFRALALDWYRRVYLNQDHAPRFTCSYYFIRDFMQRNRFSLRRQHFKRRPTTAAELTNEWIETLTNLLATHNHDLILNCDETSWRLYPNNILTWWTTGADDVSIHVKGDEKGCITVLATISASQQKWPLFFVAKGKTQRVEESQIGDVSANWRTHSESGWMNGDIFCEYLQRIRDQVPNGEQIFLICDIHASHRASCVKSLAATLNITLLYIPAGRTDQLQPLDRVVFGALKSEARRLFRRRTSHDPELKRSKRDAIADLVAAWDMLTPATLEAAWQLYENEDEWAEIENQ